MNDIIEKLRLIKNRRRGEKNMYVRTICTMSVLASPMLHMSAFAAPKEAKPTSAGAQNVQSDKNKEAAQKEERRVRYVQLTITPVVYSRKEYRHVASTKFKVGGKVIVKLYMLNTSEEPLEVATGDAYLQQRLRLLKDGQPVQYRKGVTQLLRAKEDTGTNFGGLRFTTILEPDKQTEVDTIDLERWFEKLEPGHYELTLRHRFQWKGKHVESNTVTFEVMQ